MLLRARAVLALLAFGAVLAGAASAAEYVIGPRDVLKVTVWGQEDLSKEYAVEQDGFVPLPLVGRVKAQGLTTTEFAGRVAELLEKDYLVNPQVTVTKERVFFVFGEVKKPGSYRLDKGTNVLEGITLAGGFTDWAAPAKIHIIRGTAQGQQEIRINMNEIVKRGQREKAIPLQENDVVVVPGGRLF